MNKTNPIGVRFRADLLEKLKTDHGIESPQKALIFYEKFFSTHYALAKDIKSPLRDISNIEQKKLPGLSIRQPPKKPADILNDNVTTVTLGAKPKTLDELKKLCPVDLTGLDRSEWIRTERQKYGI